MEGPSAVLNVMSLPPGATKTQARLVLDGVRGAIFLYKNGGPTGALVGSWAMAAGTDPYTNAYPQGFNVIGGSITGTQLIIKNSFGATIFEIDPAHDGWFLYAETGSATQGAMIASGAGNTGTDPVTGKIYEQGVTAYVTIGGVTYAVGLNVTNNSPGFSVQDVAHVPFNPAGVFAGSNNTARADATLSSGQTTNTDIAAGVTTSSQVASNVSGGLVQIAGGIAQVTGAIETDGTGTPPAVQNANGNLIHGDSTHVTPLRYNSGANGDGNTYAFGKLTRMDANSQLFNSVNPVQVGTISFNVIPVIIYHVEVDIFYSSTATAGAPQFGWDGGSVINHVDGYNDWHDPGNVFNTGGYFVATMGLQAGPTLTSGNHRYHTEFWVSFSTGGTFNLRGQCTIAADTFTVLSDYARMEPI